MAQARILLPEDHPEARLFRECGFHFCKKDQRWEKNGKNPKAEIGDLIFNLQHELGTSYGFDLKNYPVEIKESDNA